MGPAIPSVGADGRRVARDEFSPTLTARFLSVQQVRVLLDNNIWSRVSDRDEADSFIKAFQRRGDVVICAAPATLLELQRTPVQQSRLKRVRLVTRSRWFRLETEAKAEMDELAAELGRLRPEWLRAEPTDSAQEHLRFWSSTIWEASRRDLFDTGSPAFAAEEDAVRAVNSVTAANRHAWTAQGFNVDTHGLAERIRTARADLRGTQLGREIGPAAAALKEPVSYWRAETASVLLGLFLHPQTEPFLTYRQWLDPHIDLNLLKAHRDDLMELLLNEMTATAMTRHWLRWAMRFAQTAAKVTHGNARDEQLTGYLPDVDLLLTNDRAYSGSSPQFAPRPLD